MVNVDEINESIQKFSLVVERLEKLDDTYSQIKETREKLDQGVEKVREVSVKQSEMISDVKQKLYEMQMGTNRKIEGMKDSICDKMALHETSMKSFVDEHHKELTQELQQQLNELKQQIDVEMRKAKKERTILMIGVGLGIILLIAHFFV